jgi:hypothetical protein
MIYDRTDAELAKMPAKEVLEMYKNLRDARKFDDQYADLQRNLSLRESATAYEKLKDEYKAQLQEYTEKGHVVIGKGFSVDQEADMIRLNASLAVMKDDLKQAKALHAKVMSEFKRDGKVLDGAERYYTAEADIERLEDNNFRLNRQLNQAYGEIGDLREENAELKAKIAKFTAWQKDLSAEGLVVLKDATSLIEKDPEEAGFLKETLPKCHALLASLEKGGAILDGGASVVKPYSGKGKNRATAESDAARAAKRNKTSKNFAHGYEPTDDDMEAFLNSDSE